MARRLSDMEWATFLSEVPVTNLGLPPWGGVVEWNGMEVLVFIGASGEVFTTDISDSQALITQYAQHKTYDPASGSWWYYFPQEVLQTIANDAIAAGQVVQTTIQVVADTVGKTAGAVLKPIVEPLTPILIGAAVLLALVYLPRRG